MIAAPSIVLLGLLGAVDATVEVPFELHRYVPSTEAAALRELVPSGRPELRGLGLPVLEPDPRATEIAAPTEPPALRDAATIVATRLARDGLPRTLAAVVRRLGAEASTPEALARTGLPMDLAAAFVTGDGEPLLAWIRTEVAAGRTESELATALASARFVFAPSDPRFSVATESGEHELGLLRLQLTRGDDWQAAGDGGSVDLVRSLVAGVPDAQLLVSIQSTHLDDFMATAADWPWGNPARTRVVVDPGVVSQWAQDNGKAGVLADELGRAAPATLIPRFASRRDDGSELVPNESWLFAGLAEAGHPVVQSPLLFQGGNLLAVQEPSTGDRILLVGEAEIHRNVALGLTPRQIAEALRIELAVDRIEVLPALSFHIDYDVTVRAIGDELVAFVNDTDAAVRIILGLGIEALAAAGELGEEASAEARSRLAAGDLPAIVPIIAGVLGRRALPNGGFPLSLARAFAQDPADSAVGNFRRFLLAYELVAAHVVPPGRAGTAHAEAYLASLRARPTREAAFRARLEASGMRVVMIPSIAEAEESLVTINGIHGRRRYLMPVTGGFFAPLDEAARAAFAAELGPDVEIVPIRTAETQRRVGALHCAVSAYPR